MDTEVRRQQKLEAMRRYYARNREALKAKNAEYTRKNRARLNERGRRQRAENSEIAQADRARRTRKYFSDPLHRIQKLIASAKSRALAAGAEFDPACFATLRVSPSLQCQCCRIDLDYHARKSHRSPSLDRIHNDFGYIQGNVAVLCLRCNTLKRNGTISEFERIIEYMKRSRFSGAIEIGLMPPKAFWVRTSKSQQANSPLPASPFPATPTSHDNIALDDVCGRGEGLLQVD